MDRNINGHYCCWGTQEIPQFGYISNTNLDEIKKFDIGNGKNMPTLLEVLKITAEHNKKYKTNVTVNIEIKGKGDIVNAVYKIMSQAIELNIGFTWDSFMINSFDTDALIAMRTLHADKNLRISQGFNSKKIYGDQDHLGDKWLPVRREYSPDGPIVMRDEQPTLKDDIDVSYFDKLVAQAKENGCTAVDVVSSDLNESMMQICNKYHMSITATTNAIRARAQEEASNHCFNKTDEEIERQEVKKMFDLGQKYPNVSIYYKADCPQLILKYRSHLENPYQVVLYKDHCKPSKGNIVLTSNVNPPISLYRTLGHNPYQVVLS